MGQRVVRLLAERGHDVVALVHRLPEGAVATRLRHERIRVEILDLERPRFDTLPKDLEAVVALHQSPYHRNFPERASEIFAVNVAAQLGLLEWARGAGVRRYVQASSGGVYGAKARVGVPETDPVGLDPQLGFYLASKVCAEALLQSYRSFFESAVILRPFFAYGPGQRTDMLIPRLIDSVREGRPIKLQGPDGLRLNPVYVEDAAHGFAAALSLNGYAVLNLAGPQVVSLREIGERIGRELGKQPVFEQVDESPADYVGSVARAAAAIGAAKTTFDEGISKTIQAGQ